MGKSFLEYNAGKRGHGIERPMSTSRNGQSVDSSGTVARWPFAQAVVVASMLNRKESGESCLSDENNTRTNEWE